MKAEISIENVPPPEWPSLAPLLFTRNRADGDVRCLHSHAGEDAAAYAEELRAMAPDEACFCVARIVGAVAGVAGAEFDVALRRAWLRGPLVANGHDFEAVAAPLFDAVCALLPASIVQQAVFVGADCAEALDFYRRRGFGDEAQIDEYRALRSPPLPDLPAGLRLSPPESAWREAIGELHQHEFPFAYLNVDQLLAASGGERLTRIALAGGRPCGYVHAHCDAHSGDGHVDFLAVAQWARRRGAGRALLLAAVDWCFGAKGARAVTLTVRSDRHAAQALYESAGFTRLRSAVGLLRRSSG